MLKPETTKLFMYTPMNLIIKLAKYSLTAILLGILTSACSAPSKDTFKKNAEVVANQFFNHMAAKEYRELLKHYDKRFFERISPAMWIDNLQKLEKQIGDFQSFKQTASNVEQGFNRASAVTTVLVYRVQYQKSYSIQKLTFLSDANAGNMKIVGHYIDFPETESEKKSQQP